MTASRIRLHPTPISKAGTAEASSVRAGALVGVEEGMGIWGMGLRSTIAVPIVAYPADRDGPVAGGGGPAAQGMLAHSFKPETLS
ncbi:hypothetical protein YWS52_01160 [Chitiniphilus shinanonensis]